MIRKVLLKTDRSWEIHSGNWNKPPSPVRLLLLPRYYHKCDSANKAPACLAPSVISKPSGSAMGFPEGTPNCLTRVRPTIWIFLASGKLAEMYSCLHVHMESLYVCLCQSLREGCFEAEPRFFVRHQLWPSSSLPAPSSPGLQDASLTGA